MPFLLAGSEPATQSVCLRVLTGDCFQKLGLVIHNCLAKTQDSTLSCASRIKMIALKAA